MLIEFNGEITEKNQIDRHNRVKKKEILLFTLIPLLLDVIGIILGIAFNFIQDIWLEMLIYSLILWGIAIFVGKFPPKRALRFRLSSHIIITESEISKELLKDGQKVWAKKSISKDKKILDCGDIFVFFCRMAFI